MERLDQNYLNELVKNAKRGSSNAFAELFAAVCGRQLFYLTCLRERPAAGGDRPAAGEKEESGAAKTMEDALVDVFSQAMIRLPELTSPYLFLPWLSRLTWRHEARRCGDYTSQAAAQLPLAEGQILLMYDQQGLSVSEIADILNIANSTVRRFLKLGYSHLKKTGEEKAGKKSSHTLRRQMKKTDPAFLARLLERIFEQVGREPNTLPVEALTSYTVYRRERFTLQRAILVAALLLFLLLPALFIGPSYEVSVEEKGERGLPVYTIAVKSILPVNRVRARVRGHNLPVYEADGKTYRVEPTRNGTLSVDVELINRQFQTTDHKVTQVDAKSPALVDSRVEEDSFCLIVSDAGIGVDYKEVYAISESGRLYRPLSADAEKGIVFAFPQEAWDVYIPDHIGNTLHLALHLD